MLSYEEYYGGKFEIARAGYWDYDASGWVAVVKDGNSALYHVSHCSCYGTLEQDNGGISWTGTVEELVEMAERKADPDMPTRIVSDKDYDAGYLLELYKKVLDWAAKVKQ